MFVIVETVDPFKWAPTPTSMLISYKVYHILHMLWMCICMSTYHVITVLVVSKAFGSHKDVSCFLLRGTPQPQRDAIVESVDPINIDPTLISYVYYVLHNLHMLWVCTYMSPHHLRLLLWAKILYVT